MLCNEKYWKTNDKSHNTYCHKTYILCFQTDKSKLKTHHLVQVPWLVLKHISYIYIMTLVTLQVFLIECHSYFSLHANRQLSSIRSHLNWNVSEDNLIKWRCIYTNSCTSIFHFIGHDHKYINIFVIRNGLIHLWMNLVNR